jgi:hypothetical protein
MRWTIKECTCGNTNTTMQSGELNTVFYTGFAALLVIHNY